jgi:hypothetical protein
LPWKSENGMSAILFHEKRGVRLGTALAGKEVYARKKLNTNEI